MQYMQYLERSNHVKSVARAMLLVEAMARLGKEVSITELSRNVGWPKSTVHGILSTLRDFRYVEQSAESGFYKLGVRFFEIGSIVTRSWDILPIASPHMQRLNSRVGETVQLAMENDGEVLYLHKEDAYHIMRNVSSVGGRLPLYCTALGKVLLAYKSPAEVRAILKRSGMEARTSHTITTKCGMESELQKIREQGFAIDDRELKAGLRCVAAPIRNRAGTVLYAVSASGIYSSMQSEHLEVVRQGVVQCARDISRELEAIEVF